MIQLPDEFRARLESFRGPLDLLLYLIRKEEVDILDIPISRITEQYILYIQILKSIEPNICGEFLVMAAKLMEIKSRSLLPVEIEEQEDEEYEDPRLELVLQLLEYKKYKERALILEEMAERQSQRFQRPEADLSALPDLDDAPIELGRIGVWDLLTAFQRVQMALAMRQPHKVLFEDRPIEEYIDAIEVHLEAEGEEGVTFDVLFETCRDRYDAIGYFLAILEMAKLGHLQFDQDENFGEIRVRRRTTPQEGSTEPEGESPEAAEQSVEGLETIFGPGAPSELVPDLEEDPRGLLALIQEVGEKAEGLGFPLPSLGEAEEEPDLEASAPSRADAEDLEAAEADRDAEEEADEPGDAADDAVDEDDLEDDLEDEDEEEDEDEDEREDEEEDDEEDDEDDEDDEGREVDFAGDDEDARGESGPR